jgi:hypothetical protein
MEDLKGRLVGSGKFSRWGKAGRDGLLGVSM